MNYSNFLDADMLTDISDFEGLADIKQAYLDIDARIWNLFPETEYMRFPMQPMRQGSCTTKTCLRKTDGRFPQPGRNF